MPDSAFHAEIQFTQLRCGHFSFSFERKGVLNILPYFCRFIFWVMFCVSSPQTVSNLSAVSLSPTTAPPLPPRPSFMMSVPEYLDLLPSTLSPSPSLQKSASDSSAPMSPSTRGDPSCRLKEDLYTPPPHAHTHTHTQRLWLWLVAFIAPEPGAANKEILSGNPNVALVSLGKLITEERGQ